jgi:6-phosphogluconolactonase (cycloisomerase 2 family)
MFAYVGSRTTEHRKARGKGIEVYLVEEGSGRWSHVQRIQHGRNPSFLAWGKDQDFLYAVHGDYSEISSYKVDKRTGELSFLNEQETRGTNVVHLAVDPTFSYVVVSNHATGSLASLPILADGSLGLVADLISIEGTPGPDRDHQKGPKPHHNPFDVQGRHLIVPDKGIDEVYTVRLDPSNGKLTIVQRVKARERSGPRHVDCHPAKPWAYVLNELDFTVTAYHYDSAAGTLSPFQIVTTVPEDFAGNNSAAEIWVAKDGRFLFVSNRGHERFGHGHESIATFAIDQETGKVQVVSWEPTQGLTPRYFGLSPVGDRLLAANEDTDTIVEFSVDTATGKLTPTGQVIPTGSPTCIIFSDF